MLDWAVEGQRGPWKIEHFDITREQASLERMKLVMSFSRAIPPREGRYTRLIHKDRGVVMSDTTNELMMMDPFKDRLRGNKTENFSVHINGLGLGIAASWALGYGYDVTVVEIDLDVIALTGDRLQQLFPNKLTIIQGSALDYKPTNKEKLWAVYHDIWDEADDLNWDQYKLLHRRWGRRTLWQDSWGRDHILANKREERRYLW